MKEEEGRGEEGGRQAGMHGRLGCCSDCECSGSAAKRRWSGEMELPQEEEAAQRGRDSSFSIRSSYASHPCVPSAISRVETRGRERARFLSRVPEPFHYFEIIPQ